MTTYQIAPSMLVLDNQERKYVLTVRDLPDDERPRERLVAEGPSALSSIELLSVLLSSGTKKEEVLRMATRIMRDYGEKSILKERDAEKLSKEMDIPLGKAMQIVAAGELGRRFYSENATATPIIRTARDAYKHVFDMRTLAKEHVRGLYLNTHYKVIHDEVISIGTVDANIVHAREVFRPALEYNAVAVVLVHNHPSGDLKPSMADVEVTDTLIRAGKLLGIELIDHIIVAKEGFASIPAGYQAS